MSTPIPRRREDLRRRRLRHSGEEQPRGTARRAAGEGERGRTAAEGSPGPRHRVRARGRARQAGRVRGDRSGLPGGCAGQRAADCDRDLGTRSGRAGAQDEAPRALSRGSLLHAGRHRAGGRSDGGAGDLARRGGPGGRCAQAHRQGAGGALQAHRRLSGQPSSARDPARSLLPDRSGRRLGRGHRPRRAADARAAHVPERAHPAEGHQRPQDPRRRPGVLQTMVALGRTGLSAGKGFYDWSGCDVEAVRRQASSQLAKLLEFLRNGIGAPAPGTRPKTVSK